ncbi:MAG: phosphate acyltransferase, partial [bacterium]
MFADNVKTEARTRSGSLVFPEGNDDRIDEASKRLIDEGIVDRLLVISSETSYNHPNIERIDPQDYPQHSRVRDLLSDRFEDLDADEISDYSTEPLFVGAALVELGEVNGMVAGAAHPTASVLRAALKCLGTREGEDVVSSSFVMELDDDDLGTDGLMIFSDPAVLPNPDREQLVDVAKGAVRTYENLIGQEDQPRLAFLSFSTRGSADHDDVDKVREAYETFNQEYPEVLSDGELQVD